MIGTAMNLISANQQAALQRFADQYGRTWKSALLRLWSRGGDERHPDGPLLRQVRNDLGRDWLYSPHNQIVPTR